MRVMHVIGEMGTGGAELLVLELVRGGRNLGWESSVASAGGSREDEILRLGLADVHRVPVTGRRPAGIAKAVVAVRGAISKTNPDVIVAHNVGATTVAGLARMAVPNRWSPIVTVFHGVAFRDYRSAALLLSIFPHTVVPVSDAIADRLRQKGIRGRSPVVILNAVTPPSLPDRTEARRQLGISPA